MKKSEHNKQELQNLIAALEELKAGRPEAAIQALQLGSLTAEQLRTGLRARLRSLYVFYNGYGPKHRVAGYLLRRAYVLLREEGITDLIAPPVASR